MKQQLTEFSKIDIGQIFMTQYNTGPFIKKSDDLYYHIQYDNKCIVNHAFFVRITHEYDAYYKRKFIEPKQLELFIK